MININEFSINDLSKKIYGSINYFFRNTSLIIRNYKLELNKIKKILLYH